MGKKNKNKQKAQAQAENEKKEEVVDDAKMASSGDEEGKSGETSESDVKMQPEESTEAIGPALPPGFDDAMKEDETKEDDKENKPAAEAAPAATEAPKDEKAEEKPVEEKKDSEKDSEESKSTEGSTDAADQSSYASQAIGAVKGLGGSAMGMLASLLSQNQGSKTMPKPPADGVYDEAEIAKAEELKKQGNDDFQNARYDKAMDSYTEAIFCNVPPQKKAIYYSNRALVSIRTENYALALMDAKDAIKCDDMYVKAYYRKGSAHLALNQIDLAIKDFRQVCKMQPNNKDAREKYDEAVKEQKLRMFQEAMAYEEGTIKVNLDEILVEDSYTGPRLEKGTDEITPEWVCSLMQWQKDRKVLHKRYAIMIIMKAKEIFEKCKSLVDITREPEEEVTVCGDIHGQYYDLLNIFTINGNPSQANPYLFNGDFIDRGSFSVEVIMTMLAWKVCLPNHFFMSRGNHETKQLNKLYGFYGEVNAKYDNKVYELFNDLFQHLPLCHCINAKVFVTHGGLFAKDDVTLEMIRKTPRFKEPADEGIMVDCLWSDPSDMPGRLPSKRGISCMFGPDVTQKFLEKNNLELVVRSHEVKMPGYEYQKGGKCLTIFSAPNYCDQMGNKGAFIRFKGSDMKPQITSFDKVDHPKVPPMAYANRFGSLF